MSRKLSLVAEICLLVGSFDLLNAEAANDIRRLSHIRTYRYRQVINTVGY